MTGLEDLFVELFIGRDPEDLIDLAQKYQIVYKRNLSSISNMVRDKDLERALEIVSEQGRPNSNQVDSALVQRDFVKISQILTTSFPRAEDLFEILLRRSDSHIQQLSIMYNVQTKPNMPLDMAIRQNTSLKPMAKSIGVHAVRTATNMTYRDSMLLHDALGRNSIMGGTNKQKLAIRVTRMHFYKQHWKQVKGDFGGVSGKDFKTKMSHLSEGPFRNLMYAMSMV